jgi:hypothetical protein
MQNNPPEDRRAQPSRAGTVASIARRVLPLLLIAAGSLPLSAQRPLMPADTGGVGFHVIAMVTEARPAVGGESRRERYLTQPMLLLHDPGPRFSGHLMLNFEAWTLGDGELNAGTWGEGFIDRRHPHTFLHELMFSTQGTRGLFGVSVSGGRGFVPFGSDDPMTRPFVKYPFNHHLAQVLERWAAVGALRVGRVAIEGAAFNGDEPDGPRSLGERERFGDSWASRVTLWPIDALELQASHARVESPEHPDGGGLDHEKWHGSGRLDFAVGAYPVYALYEWARTDELDAGVRAFRFTTSLLEGAADVRQVRLALRWERTTRPEEPRVEDPFRTARPHEDATLLGVTRWEGLSAHLAGTGGSGELHVSPFLEVGRFRVREVTGALFDPVAFYGGEVQWSLSAGLRIGVGVRTLRTGRYGVALRSGVRTGTMH